MKTQITFRGIAAIVIGSQSFGEYYENPYNHKYSWRVGEHYTYKTLEHTDQVLTATITEKNELISLTTSAGTQNGWRTTTINTPANGGLPQIEVEEPEFISGSKTTSIKSIEPPENHQYLFSGGDLNAPTQSVQGDYPTKKS